MYHSEDWFNIIEHVSREMNDNFGQLDSVTLNQKPNPGSWSIAQILDHIIKINDSYKPVVEQLRSGNYRPGFLGRQEFMTRFWYRMIYNSILPSNAKKAKTRPVWEPSQSAIDGAIVQQFLAHQQQFQQFIRDVDDLVKSEAIIHSPAGKFITYTMGAAIDIMTQHELRHLNQAKGVLAQVQQQK